MGLTPQHLQWLVTAGMFAIVSVVAIICEHLRRNNLQLRELAVQLDARCAEQERSAQAFLPVVRQYVAETSVAETHKRVAVEAGANAGTPVAVPVPAKEAKEDPKDTALPIAASENPEAAVPASRPIRERQRHSAPRKSAREVRRPLSADAVAAIERGVGMAALPHLKARELGNVTQIDSRVKPAISEPEQFVLVAAASTSAAPSIAALASPGTTLTSGSGKKDWGALLLRNSSTLVSSGLLDQVVAATSSQPSVPSVPPGFHEGLVLRQLVQQRRPVNGLVVSVGVEGQVTDQVRWLITSLLGPDDFACQATEDEFLLIYPEERGGSAQRRLNTIAEELWCFQLKSLGKYEIRFSWGGVEVRGETMDEAVAGASERMHETLRTRQAVDLSQFAEAV